MAFSNIVKKASNLLGLGGCESLRPPPLDGEIIYCKNNVCTHPPATLLLDTEHHPGYLTLRAQQNQSCRPTLILTWIPNATLKKNPQSIESSPVKSRSCTPKVSPRRNPKQEFAKSDESTTLTPSPCASCSSCTVQDSCHVVVQQVKTFSQDTTSSSICSTEEEWGASNVGEEEEDMGGSTSHTHSGSEEAKHHLQNNEKSVHAAPKPCAVGLHVNSWDKTLTNCDTTNQNTDELTSEEQFVAMLNRNKLHVKIKDKISSNMKPVSIEIEGDKLVVVTEQQEGNCSSSSHIIDHNINRNESKFETSSSQSTDIETPSLSSDSNNQSPSSIVSKLAEDGLPDLLLPRSAQFKSRAPLELHIAQTTCPPPNTPALTPDVNTPAQTPDVQVAKSRSSSSSSTTTSGPDSRPITPCTSETGSAPTSPHQDSSNEPPESPSSSSSSAGMSHNLTFPQNAIMSTSTCCSSKDKHSTSARDQVCGVFSVDLGEMRSLRLFYSDCACTQGQIVIASRESQYKILHFHNGGLDKLAEIFEDWSLFAQETDEAGEGDKPYRQFLVVKPHLTDDQCHPEELMFSTVTEAVWAEHMTADGSIEDVFQLRKAIFFGGLEPSIRHQVWPFLLHYFPFSSTFEEREQIRNDKYIQYQNIRKVRESMSPEIEQQFWRSIQCIVEKDVIRTDRSHPYFRGEHNPNIQVLKHILLNYAIANPLMGYTQGMSDLLAPVLAAVQQESDAYWCFTGLMTQTIFVSSPRDTDMDKQLNYLRELLRVTLPKFHYHLKLLGQDAMELLFCHRWILLCFKREFCEEDALHIWEACWARYQTEYFHLFVCVAIVAIYGDDVVEQRLPADEILLHFSSLAMHMNGQLVLKKARGLLHEFRRRLKIPCTLYGLCSQVNSGMWDSGHVPTVECIGHLGQETCSYNSSPSSPPSLYGDG